jgi:uncharacterized surface protein with fasciclin (FAS1) repeats
MKRLNIKFSNIVLATIVSLGSVATTFAFGNINRAVANEQMGENSSISQDTMGEDTPMNQDTMGEDTPMNQGTTGEDTPMNQGTTGEDTPMNQDTSSQDSIASQLSNNESFNTLAQAVEAAGLVEDLQTTGEYTVFAPTDEAFEALPAGTLDALLQPENQDILRQILAYHIVLGAANSNEISSGFFETAAGSGVEIDVANGMVQVGNARVTQPDIQASNGVIHGINQVILPPDISMEDLQALSQY